MEDEIIQDIKIDKSSRIKKAKISKNYPKTIKTGMLDLLNIKINVTKKFDILNKIKFDIINICRDNF